MYKTFQNSFIRILLVADI